MNKKYKILLSVLLICTTMSQANAGWKKKAAVLVGARALAQYAGPPLSAIYVMTLAKKTSTLGQYPKIANEYLATYPEDRQSVSEMAKEKLEHFTKFNNIYETEKYKQLLDVINQNPIPPFKETTDNNPIIHDNPINESNNEDSLLTHPLDDTPQQNMIATPEGGRFDSKIEYPYEEPKTWEDYLLLKNDYKELRENLLAEDSTSITLDDAAHHIVPLTAKDAKDARKILTDHGIGLNSAVNGVGLPKEGTANPKNMLVHNGRHPDNYVKQVNKMIVEANTRGGKSEVLNELKYIKNILKNAPKGTEWKNVL